MTREKRSLDRNGKDDVGAPEEKRHKVPQLASVIVEALKVDSLQKLCSSLEPILRRVVSEEVERALAKLGPAKLGLRASPKQIEGGDGRNLQLHFKTRLSLPLFTGGKVEGERGAAIHVVLLDATTGQVITSGPESSIKLEVTVLEGDFNNEDDDDWTQEEFESHEVREREGKRPLLTGDLQVGLKEGVGSLGDLMFTDNSSWIRSRKFRLGVKVAAGFCEGIRVREAKTESFTVKDHRGELYKKHYPPALHDEVWRLDKIGKDGAFHKKLNKAGIHTVEDFLRHVVREPQKLRNILGSGMSNKMWESTVEHAKTCVLSGKLYVYYADASRNVGVVFNNVYELQGLIANGQYLSAEALSDADKVHVDVLVKKAYDDWVSVVEYDGKALIGLKSNKKSCNICTETSIPALQYSAPYTQQPSLTESVAGHADQSSANAGLTLAAGGPSNVGFNDRSLTRYAQPSQQFQANSQLSYRNLTYSTSNQVAPGPPNHTSLLATDNVVGLALGPSPQQLPVVMSYQSMGTVIQQPGSSTNGAEDWSNSRDQRGPVDDYFSEEEIRSKSMEMLENEDMQNLLRMFTSGGVVNASDDGFHYPPFTPIPSFNYSDAGTRSSGKAVVGWLKLKAALRWGIFIRKIAAEKRAQIEELDD